MMKKAAFALGYAGSILALIFSLMMIYTVPYKIASNVVEQAKNGMGNKNVLAFNEMVLHAGEITDWSERGILDFAASVAKKSDVLTDRYVYENTASFAYGVAWGAIICAVLIALSVICALVSFIGSLVCRKARRGGGIMMLVSAFILILAAIYTETILPMAAACLLLTLGGIFALVPAGKPLAARQSARMPQAPAQWQNLSGHAYPQQPYYPQAPARSAGVPFPEEEPRDMAQSEGERNITE